ncbi:MAG: hypothetical protein IJ733_18635 [Lachnospiraceae bacterium]|nr:hypothetical protein [Lachnospiraceae bacterium]
MKRLGKQAICLTLAAMLIMAETGMAGAKRTSAASKVITGYYTDGYWSVSVQNKGNKAKVRVSWFVSNGGCATYKVITGKVKNNKMLYYAESIGTDSKIKVSMQFQGKKIKCTVLPLKKYGWEKKFTFTVKKKSKNPSF